MSLKELFRPEAVEHRRQRLHGEVTLTMPVTHWSVSLLIAAFLGLLVAALFTVSYARKQTVTGWIRPDRGLVQVFTEQTAVVEQVLVAEGQVVQAGQPLMTLRSGGAMADGTPAAHQLLASLQREREQVEKQLSAGQGQLRLRATRLQEELAALAAEEAQIHGQWASQKKRVAIAQGLLEQRLTLVKQGFLSEVDAKTSEERVLELEQDAGELERRLLLRRQQADARRHDLAALPLEREASTASLNERLAALDQRVTDLTQRKRLSVAAPVSGQIGSLRIKAGETATDKLALADIQPQGARLQAELFAPSQAIGLLRAGAPVRLRLDSYPHEKFGTAEGRVLQIAPTSSMPAELPQGPGKSGPVFRIVVELAQEQVMFERVAYRLQPGMTLTADVLLERRKLAEHLFAPLLGLAPSQ